MLHAPTTPGVLLACASLGTTALAQESVSLSLTHGMNSSVVEIGQVVTWTLTMEHAGFSDGSLNSSVFAALWPSIDDLGGTSDFAYTQGFNGGTNGGTAEGMGFALINFTNSFLGHWQIPVDQSNPLVIGTFTTTVTDTGSGALSYELAPSPLVDPGFPVAAVEGSAFSTTTFSLEQISFHSDFIVVPAPASALLLTPTGLLAVRRRRFA